MSELPLLPIDSANAMQAMDALEVAMVQEFPRIECPVSHIFTPGLYTRIITMPAGSIIASKIHGTRHPFTILRGKCQVFNALVPNGSFELLEAPYFGITQPNTRRCLLILEETVWATFHPTQKTTPEEVEAEIMIPHTNELLEKRLQ